VQGSSEFSLISGPGLDSLSWLAAQSPAPDGADQEAARGAALMQQGRFQEALEHFELAVALAPGNPEYHHLLAGAADKAGRLDLAGKHLAEAVRLNPAWAEARYALATHLHKVGELERGLEHATAALELEPRNTGYLTLRATLLMASGQAGAAWEAIEPLITAGETDRWLVHLYARLAPSLGHEERALEALKRAMEVPGLSAGPSGKPLLHFAAARLLDRLGRYGEAFEEARRGNDLVRTVSRPHDPAGHSEWITRKTTYFTRRRLDSLPRATHESRRPVFIVGMPRSGTTLVEQILASHPAVFGAGELEHLRLIAKGSSRADWSEGENYPESLDGLSLARANRLAAQYLGMIEALDGGAATYVTDKQPLNFLILDLVELLFPNCHVIHCIRNPLDTCLSNFITNFEAGNEFKFDLGHLGAYHRDYRRLMEHWKKVLSVPVLDVRYEDVVLDTEGQVRRILEFLDLPWDERCLRYYENVRRVRTASEDQVRRPIYTSAIGRWKHYEGQLGELIAALGRSGGAAAAHLAGR
jgi:tetratricopeptide (TPR) repeat protein